MTDQAIMLSQGSHYFFFGCITELNQRVGNWFSGLFGQAIGINNLVADDLSYRCGNQEELC